MYTVKKMLFDVIGKLLCNICECQRSYVDCSAKGLDHMPWTDQNFGVDITG